MASGIQEPQQIQEPQEQEEQKNEEIQTRSRQHTPKNKPRRIEPLLQEQKNRYVLYPIQHDDVWAEYKKQVSCFWTPEELDFSQDLVDWERLNDNEKHFIKHVLAFFAGSDGIVMENLGERFQNEVQWNEAKMAYGFQNMMEGVHSETYSLMIDTFVKDGEEKARLFQAIDTIP